MVLMHCASGVVDHDVTHAVCQDRVAEAIGSNVISHKL